MLQCKHFLLNFKLIHSNLKINSNVFLQPYNTSEVHESQNYIQHCWQEVRIKVICKSKAWCLVHTDKVPRWAADIRPVFIQSFRTYIIRNRCHFHRFCIQPIIHMPKPIMDIICYRFQRATNFTKISIRYAKTHHLFLKWFSFNCKITKKNVAIFFRKTFTLAKFFFV